MSDEALDRIAGWCCPADDRDPFTKLLGKPYFDKDGFQRGTRINGIAQCPECGLWWPLIEEVEAWVSGDEIGDAGRKFSGKWVATEWGIGTAECLDCGCIVIDSFDGCYLIRP